MSTLSNKKSMKSLGDGTHVFSLIRPFYYKSFHYYDDTKSSAFHKSFNLFHRYLSFIFHSSSTNPTSRPVLFIMTILARGRGPYLVHVPISSIKCSQTVTVTLSKLHCISFPYHLQANKLANALI